MSYVKLLDSSCSINANSESTALLCDVMPRTANTTFGTFNIEREDVTMDGVTADLVGATASHLSDDASGESSVNSVSVNTLCHLMKLAIKRKKLQTNIKISYVSEEVKN